MKSVWIVKPGPPEALEVREGPDPTPKPGEALVRVRASGVNFADVSSRLGYYPDAPPRPCIVGYEVAGIVEQGTPDYFFESAQHPRTKLFLSQIL